MVYLLNTLLDNEGNILIPGLLENIVPVTEAEQQMYESIDFDVDEFQADIGAYELRSTDKVR